MSSQLHSGSLAIALSAWPATEDKTMLAGFAAGREGPPYPEPKPMPVWVDTVGVCKHCGVRMDPHGRGGYVCTWVMCPNNPTFSASAKSASAHSGEAP